MKKIICLIIKLFLSIIISIFFIKYMRIMKQGLIFLIFVIIFYYLIDNYKKFKLNKEYKYKKIFYIFCSIFSFFVMCGYHLYLNDSISNNRINTSYFTSFNIIDIIEFIFLLFSIILVCSYLINISYKYLKKIKLNNNIGIASKKSWLKISLILFLLYLPYFLIYYPGIIFPDSMRSILQAFNYMPFSNHMPIVYTLFIKGCIEVGKLINNITIGLSFYTIIQMIFLSLSLGYMVCWLRNKGISKIICIFVLLLYGLVPFYANHSITFWKDPIFSACLSILTLYLYDLVLSKGKIMHINKTFNIKFIFLLLIVCFFRNNGVYILIILSLYLLILILNKKYYFKELKTLFFSVLIVIIGMFFVQYGYKKYNINEPFVESVGILLNQMSAVVANNGKLNVKEKEFMNNLLPLAEYKKYYNPSLVDDIKWAENFNNTFLEKNKINFFKTYFSLFIKNPYMYFKSYLLNTYGFWTINRWELNFRNDNIYMGDLNNKGVNQLKKQLNIEGKNLLKFDYFKKIFVLNDSIFSVSLINWIILLIIVLIFMRKQFKYLLSLLPSIGLIITILLATPIAYWPRYELLVYYLLPFYIYLFIKLFDDRTIKRNITIKNKKIYYINK